MKCRVITMGAWGVLGDIVDVPVEKVEDLPHSVEPISSDAIPDDSFESEDSSSVEAGENDVTEDDLRRSALRKIYEDLDHENDQHWTDSGQPSMAVFNTVALERGVPDATRAELRDLLPDAVRRQEESA